LILKTEHPIGKIAAIRCGYEECLSIRVDMIIEIFFYCQSWQSQRDSEHVVRVPVSRNVDVLSIP